MLPGNFENYFKLDRHPEREAVDADHKSNRRFLVAKDVPQQV